MFQDGFYFIDCCFCSTAFVSKTHAVVDMLLGVGVNTNDRVTTASDTEYQELVQVPISVLHESMP